MLKKTEADRASSVEVFKILTVKNMFKIQLYIPLL